jgi:1,4-alpha-glucan branching enzyme
MSGSRRTVGSRPTRPPPHVLAGRPGADGPDAGGLTPFDLYLFNEGTNFRLHEKLGAHPVGGRDAERTRFAVWAPNASRVSVVGSFNDWRGDAAPLAPRGSSGIFEGVVDGAAPGALYKYRVESRAAAATFEKADPVGFRHEVPPKTASVVWDLDYEWRDTGWMRDRGAATALDRPVSIYEVHLGSWRRVPEEGHRSLTYREAAEPLVEYVRDLGFSHVEFLPLTEHPFYASWGYEPTGLFAPTARYGSPQDLMALVDALHRAGIGVVLDWVPSHFPTDAHGLGFFDGTHLYEHADPRRGFHPDWNTFLYNYGRHEVRSFLVSSAMFWLERYHVDALRVDGVASMLYLDYSRPADAWIPNEGGGRENWDAIRFLRQMNEVVYANVPGAQTIAEESTAWPMVSRPTWLGGLGFGYKWDLGWMHDTLLYFGREPVHRKYHHDLLTFRALYAGHENFILPLSHDEVVHGKGSLLAKMPGDPWQRFANLRLLYAYQFALPGKKLLFMGDEFGQWNEWRHDHSLDWHLLGQPYHGELRAWVRRLNAIYRERPALFARDYEPGGFEWIDTQDRDQSVLSFLRRGSDEREAVLGVFNFTPVPRAGYRVGAPRAGGWRVLANSDDTEFGGSGAGTRGSAETEPAPYHGRLDSLVLSLPPLGALWLAPEG